MERVGSDAIRDLDDVTEADGAARSVADEVASRLAGARTRSTS
jgi:hypothetical protein